MKKIILIIIGIMFAISIQASEPAIKRIPQDKDSELKVEPWMTNKSTWRQHRKMDRQMYRRHHSHRQSGHNYVKKEG